MRKAKKRRARQLQAQNTAAKQAAANVAQGVAEEATEAVVVDELTQQMAEETATKVAQEMLEETTAETAEETPEATAETDEQAAQAEAKRKKRRAKQWREIRSFVTNLVLTVGAVWAIFTFVFGIYILDGEDMYPRMRDGDLVLFFRMENDYVVDDVLTFTDGDDRYTARYVAMAGDVVDITEDGFLLINGSAQTEEIFYGTYPAQSEITYPYTVPTDSVFLLGDFRTMATDSRVFGAIPLDEIDGKVITLLRRRVI